MTLLTSDKEIQKSHTVEVESKYAISVNVKKYCTKQSIEETIPIKILKVMKNDSGTVTDTQL